ncbi:cytochrome c oxidase assembly protein [Streptomyces iconiensis]|uniref:Cytochrome c oxidase assembly protein n=1 Tax=Streptomyces iconiensis TaxID=1384038 RepID=A0ABT6ZZQ5_9ACTN|nr:cytochrome c oxidase assembly protein [Streptomyces iconiensis]MDJ1134535.1 cytochrome c oxidase assembly protein [Streptomyces iconiensis]
MLDVALPVTAVLILGAGYLLLAALAREHNPTVGWSRWRTGWFLTGLVLLGGALVPPLAPFAHADFRGHMLQHLLIGMYAPLALVLGAPVTLLLRTLPARHARRLARALRSRPLHLVANPAVALLLSVGSLGALYFTPLYEATAGQALAHHALHAHFLLSGCLFAWVIAGPDPAPSRPGVPARLCVLGVAIAGHATLSQLMYAGLHLGVRAPAEQVQGGAEIMYYGGDIAELLLAAALVATWRPVRRARTARSPDGTATTHMFRPGTGANA